MQRLTTTVLSLTLLVATSSAALAQSAVEGADAEAAMKQARAAYQAADYPLSRDLAKKASETDPNNPEVHLLLGQAHYQLGELDEAITAWKRTLRLAPEQPYAAKMLAVLRGEAVEIDTRIKLIEVMLAERLYDPALGECRKLMADEALSDAQRVKTMTLQAESLVRMHKGPEARTLLHELLERYPRQADPVQTTLLMGEAKLQGDAQSAREALVSLQTLVADHPDTPAAARARYDIITHDPKLADAVHQAEAMANWLAANADHELADDARRSLLDTYLTPDGQLPKPTADSQLSPTDVQALALTAELSRREPSSAKVDALTSQLLGHIKQRYVAAGAYTAAVQAMETMLAMPLPKSSRLLVRKDRASAKYLIASKWLDETGRTGQLPVSAPRGELPKKLADVFGAFEMIRADYPATTMWIDQANLAKRVRASTSKVLPTAEFKGLNGPEAWALTLAMPVIQANGDAEAVKSAVETIQAIIQARSALDNPASRKLAVDLSTELLGATPTESPSWTPVLVSYYTTVQSYFPYVFQENIKAGKPEANAQLSELQKAYLASLKNRVAINAADASQVPGQLALHVKPWTQHGHWAVAEEVYTTLMPALPEKERRQADLAVVGLWIRQVTEEHQRLTAAGLTVPRELDPTLKKALLRCRRLQAGLEQEKSTLGGVRTVWDSIIAHYKVLQYYDVAQEAIEVKSDEAVELADEYATLRLVVLQDEEARRGLTRRLAQYGASDKIVLGAEFQAVIAGYTKFIADRPTSPLVSQATERVFLIGQLFTQRGAHDVAADVYGRFAKFAAGVPILTQSPPGGSSTTQRASYAVATALDTRARTAMAKWAAERKGDDPAPEKISDEFAAAIASYQAFVETYPDGPLVGTSIGKIMAVALQYAKVDAWGVADSIYEGLLQSKLAIRHPERLKFCRGLAQLGPAMPDHARQLLATLTAGGLRDSGRGDGRMLVAWNGADRSTLSVSGGLLALPGPDGAPRNDSPTGATATRSPAGRAMEPVVNSPASQPQSVVIDEMLNLQIGAESTAEAERDVQLLAMIQQQESNRASQVAQLRENFTFAANAFAEQGGGQQAAQQETQQRIQQVKLPAVPVLSEAELARQEKAIAAAYATFQAIRKAHRETPTARQARAEILVMVGHWRGLGQWERSAALALQFLGDNPKDAQLPKLRLEVARDRLTFASQPIERRSNKQEMLAEVSKRFDAARGELTKIVADFPEEPQYRQDAQWDIANSFLSQARVVAAFSPTMARGQYVRTTRELRQVAKDYPNHPKIGTIPQMLWSISIELEGRGYYDEAILAWNELSIHDPMNPLAQQAAMKIAQTYHQRLKRPLRAAQAYQELNFARGGNDQNLQNAIFQIGSELKNEKRWVEALHVMETFVDSFPRHPQAGQALTMVGQIHQTNEAWKDAITAYKRVITEFENGQFVQEAKWSIAECTINLSQWREASDAYRGYVAAYAQDAKIEEANRRIEVLKDLVRYQELVDEAGQRKAFDAQFQIATIVAAGLSNPVKAIIEYRKVVTKWPTSHLADDALFAVGTTYLSLGDTEKARVALLTVASEYPTSTLADDALFAVGKSHEDEAGKLATVTRASTFADNKDVAQRKAYQMAQSNRYRQAEVRNQKVLDLKKAGKSESAEVEEASLASNFGQFNDANVLLFAQKAEQEVETLTATQLADRQDKINSALRKAVDAYRTASRVAGADKADEALLQMATIYDQRLKDSEAAMETWLEIVRQFSGTSVAEDASWRIAQTYERAGKTAEAIEAYKAFLRNYRGGQRASAAQFAIAENYEQLGEWVNAMDSYSNYLTNFPTGPLAEKAKSQINWIKTYRL